MGWAFRVLVLLVLIVLGPDVYLRFLRPSTDWSAHRGEWALVTGSSFGIGRSFAMELAQRGMNIILHARTKGKLEEVKHEITAAFPTIQVRIIVQDAVNDPQWDSMGQQIAGLNIRFASTVG
jgi:short-subunit dehydrogenase